MRTQFFFLLLAVVATAPSSRGQTTAPRDAQAVSLASQSLKALVGSTPITDVTVQATANYIAGSDQESGTATLVGHVGNEANITLVLSGGQRSEVENFSSPPPQGKWSGPDGVWHATAMHNCWTDPTWFFPALTLQSALNNPQISFAYVGEDTKAGVTVQHIQISRLISGQSSVTTALIKELSQEDIYLDATSYLPVAIDFNEHSDKDAGRSFPVEIRFSGWQTAGGFKSPSQIQKFLQNHLVLDFYNLSAAVNTGIPQSDFAIQTTTSIAAVKEARHDSHA